jgi:hypothetical protein
MEEKDR